MRPARDLHKLRSLIAQALARKTPTPTGFLTNPLAVDVDAADHAIDRIKRITFDAEIAQSSGGGSADRLDGRSKACAYADG
jgi:hypothetical protein